MNIKVNILAQANTLLVNLNESTDVEELTVPSAKEAAVGKDSL